MIFSFHTSLKEFETYLREQGFIHIDENVLSIEKPGEGNMNFVARIYTQKRNIIIKQANPYVQKYPHIPAPQERVFVETEFYKTIQDVEGLGTSMPSLIGLDKTNYLIVLQDLGEASDFNFLYQKGRNLNQSELEQLIQFLNVLHAIPPERLQGYSNNLSLRKLNYEHLFNYPFMEDNGFDLDQVQRGLLEISRTYKTDQVFIHKVKSLGDIYLSEGHTLLHGDYYPGSWLNVKNKVNIIDPEFSFVGNKEFELGIFIAHLKMSEASREQIDNVMTNYEAGTHFDWNMCYQFTGIEIMRRIIGLAQLPLDLSLPEKDSLLKEAYTYIVK